MVFSLTQLTGDIHDHFLQLSHFHCLQITEFPLVPSPELSQHNIAFLQAYTE